MSSCHTIDNFETTITKMRDLEKEHTRIDHDLCISCGLCINACGRKLIKEVQGAFEVTNPDHCNLCGHCKAVCPVNAPLLSAIDQEDFIETPPRSEYPSPLQFLSFLRARRSIMIFTDEPVEREKLLAITNAGRYAPTARNRQALGYVVVHDPAKIEALRSLTIETLLGQANRLDRVLKNARRTGIPLTLEDRAWKDYPPAWRFMARLKKKGADPLFHDAPAVIVCHVSPEESLHPEVEAGMASMQMALMAEVMGLGTCFCGLLDYAAKHSRELRNLLGIPDGHKIPVSFMVGYPGIKYIRLVAREPARIIWH